MKEIEGGITAIEGIRASGISCGIKGEEKDLALIYSENPAVFDAVFTKNKVKAAPVLLSEIHAESKIARAIIINSGNANACTGNAGMRDAVAMVEEVSKELGVPKERVMVASTGVIGQALPIDKILSGVPKLVKELSVEGGQKAAEAIMTTDTFPKSFAVKEEKEGSCFKVGGIAKGSGMIAPNMATMLSMLATDAHISPKALQQAFRYATNRSFNCISIDGAMSTNDTAMIMATGKSPFGLIEEGTSDFFLFREVLTHVMLHLAKEVVRDGEGATMVITVRVENADSVESAEKVARTIANSLLVKTAFFGKDLNWGRILAAAGSSGVDFCPENVDMYLNDSVFVENGESAGEKREKEASEHLVNKEVSLRVSLNTGNASAEIFTNDLSYEYIKINADYRT